MLRDWYKFFLLAVSTLTEATKNLPSPLYLFYVDLTIL